MSPVSRRKALQLCAALLPSTGAGCLSGAGSSTPETACQPSSPGPSPTADRWPMIGSDPTNTGYTPLTTGRQHAPPAEEVAPLEIGNGGFAFGNDALYVGAVTNDTGRLYALDSRTGEVGWTVETPAPVTGSPALDPTTVYVVTGRDESNSGPGKGVLHAVARDDGTEQWRADLGGETISSPVVADDHVYIGRDTVLDSWLFAFDAATGEEVWRFDTGDYFYGWPAVTSAFVYIVGADFRLYALDRQSGTVQWEFGGTSSDHHPGSPPTVVEGTVIVGTGGSVVAVNACTGAHEWTVRTDDQTTNGGVLAGVSVGGDTVYASVARHDSRPGTRVVALDRESGSNRWSTDVTPDTFWLSKPVVTDDTVFVGLSRPNRGVQALATEDGTVRWTTDAGGRRLIAANNKLYSADQGQIYSFALDT